MEGGRTEEHGRIHKGHANMHVHAATRRENGTRWKRNARDRAKKRNGGEKKEKRCHNCKAAYQEGDGPNEYNPDLESKALPENYCLIESRETVMDFAKMDLEEIELNIMSRRNKIFLLMEEVRRLRIQKRLKGRKLTNTNETEEQEHQAFPSALPFLPEITQDTITDYYIFFAGVVSFIIFFGGVIAPTLEVKMGLGGQSYAEFIDTIGLPSQLSQVDPIVASFCGGAVGVLSALLVVEINNVHEQEKKRCLYCKGTGYLACGACGSTGKEPTTGSMCIPCSGTGKVMCPSCLCTGMGMATEHDPRVDPFD